MPDTSSLILGAGISGLTIASRLSERGHTVTVLDSAARPGGAIQTVQEDGYTVELGPNTIQCTSPQTEEFLSWGNLSESLVQPSPLAANRYLVRDGRPLAAPASPLAALRTPLFSTRAKLRLAAEFFLRPAPADEDESLADFARRRVGAEFLDYALNPMVAGVYAGDPERLSVRHAFPKVYNLEANYGGLLRGAIRLRREKRRAGTLYKSRLLSYKEGLETLPCILAERLGSDLHLGTTLNAIAYDAEADQPFTVSWQKAGESPTQRRFGNLVLALPPRRLDEVPLPPELAQVLAPLQAIHAPPLASLALGFRREDVRHPLDGFGMLVPEKEKRSILGTLFSSSLFENRAPEGHVLLTTFVGGMRQPELATLPPDKLRETVLRDLRELLGVDGKAAYEHLSVWEHAIPQYTIGYGHFLDSMQTAEKAFPGLIITGNHREGISVEKCILGALERADALN